MKVFYCYSNTILGQGVSSFLLSAPQFLTSHPLTPNPPRFKVWEGRSSLSVFLLQSTWYFSVLFPEKRKACLSVCVYVCFCVCMYVPVCMYLCVSMCFCVSLCACVCLYVCLHVCLSVCAFVCISVCKCVTVYIFVCLCIYMHMCVGFGGWVRSK